MPQILMINGYQISFWSNENGEPIHVHVSKQRPSQSGTKLWLLSNMTFVMANPKDHRIPKKDLNQIIRTLNSMAWVVRDEWVKFHGYAKYYK